MKVEIIRQVRFTERELDTVRRARNFLAHLHLTRRTGPLQTGWGFSGFKSAKEQTDLLLTQECLRSKLVELSGLLIESRSGKVTDVSIEDVKEALRRVRRALRLVNRAILRMDEADDERSKEG